MKLSLALLAHAAAASGDSWAYLCLGSTHGCVLAQHSADGAPFYTTLESCEDSCPQIGKQLSYTCSNSGNCEIATHPPNATGYYPSLQACSHNPHCFAPGKKTISYECQTP